MSFKQHEYFPVLYFSPFLKQTLKGKFIIIISRLNEETENRNPAGQLVSNCVDNQIRRRRRYRFCTAVASPCQYADTNEIPSLPF